MARKKVTRVAEEYVERHRADMSVRELADELGLSKSTVQRMIRKLGCYSEPTTAVEARTATVQPADCDELVLLKALAEQLWSRISQAKDQSVPQLSREYRETLAKITMLEASGEAPAQEAGEVDVFDAARAGIS